jgi:cytochrome P450
MIDPDTYADGMPYDELARIRKSGPIHYMDDPTMGVPYWLVTGREEIDFISKNPDLFSSEARTALADEHSPEDIEVIHKNMTINMDPPRQLKSRKIVRATFTPRAVDSYEERFREHARNITNTMMFNQDASMAVDKEAAEMASFKVIEYAMKLAAEHQDNPKDDIIGALLRGTERAEGLDESEFVWFFLMLIAAGNESTRTVTSHGMRLLMEHPDQLQYLVDNPDKIPNACEEMLRYNTAFILMRRTAMEDVEVGGAQIRKGDKIILHYHTVNHDESIFGEDAMEFDVTRAERIPDLYNQHRAFGIGQHFCLGTHLARLEMRVMFEEIIPRMRNPKLQGDIVYTRSNLVNGIREMHITFDPEVKRNAA